MKIELNITVRELVEYALSSGNLTRGTFDKGRSLEGIRGHQKVQQDRPEEYTKEVSVSHKFDIDQFIIDVTGRIDGVFLYPEKVIIEEIKTTRKDPDRYEEKENKYHWSQLKIYSYVYMVEHGFDEIDAQLTYYHIETGKTKEFREKYAKYTLEIFFKEILAKYMDWATRVSNWQQVRDQSIHKLDFPFDEYRKGQRKMAVDSYMAIKTKKQLIVQAPTGIGKTIAVLFPAIKAMAEGYGEKIFYLTARTTGRIAAEKAIKEMRNRGLRIKSLVLTAKEKICLIPGTGCDGDECIYALGYYDRIQDVLKSLYNVDEFSKDLISEAAGNFSVCPFELSLDLSLFSDCIICDYNYAFDPRVYLRRFFQKGDMDYTFLIDEAHNLPDRAREMFSAQIRKQPYLDLRRKVKDKLPELYKNIGKINSCMIKERKNCTQAGDAICEKDQPDGLNPLLETFIRFTEQWLSQNKKASFQEELLDLYFDVIGFVKISAMFDDSYSCIKEKFGNDLRLKLFCIDPSKHIEKALKRCRSAIFFSATMTPADYFKHLLGCDESVYYLSLSSPFPGENLSLLIADRISTYFKDREKTGGEVVKALIPVVESGKGNYLVFFPSYQYMMMIHDMFEEICPSIEIIHQTRGMAENERQAFLDRFSDENPKTLVGFAVMGGIFGEGVDLVGDRLKGAIIVGVGLPNMSLEQDLIRNYFEEKSRVGFNYAYLFPGFNRVLQAAGRVIRTEKDRGVVLLVDKRFATMRYRSLFPADWHPVSVQDEEKIRDILARFHGVR